MDATRFNTIMRSEIAKIKGGFRTDSSAFLVWYLYNFFRISLEDARDSVCDNQGDKGIDAIWVDETSDQEEIYIFQSKFSDITNANQGDNDLRNFVGARAWFQSSESVNNLLAGTANRELKSLVERLRIAERVSKGCNINAVFITNKKFDYNAIEYLNGNQRYIEGLDFPALLGKYSYVAEEEAVCKETTLSLANGTFIEYSLVPNVRVFVLPVQVKELLRLDGIQDNRLFSKNVRYGLGRTRVNKDITSTLRNRAEHEKIFLYHNGITVVCSKLDHQADNIMIKDYSVVNGCQSMLTFFENSGSISDNTYILTKVVEIPNTASVNAEQITYWANNQNAISVRDLKANDVIQRSIKNEFDEFFDHRVLYRRQKGDSSEGYEDIVERDFAAQLVAAFYMNQPYITHQRDSLFTDRYYDVFSKNINAAKIYLAYIVYAIVNDNSNLINFEPVRDYGLAHFFMVDLIARLLKDDPKGKRILSAPEKWVKGKALEEFENAVTKLFKLLVYDVDNYISDWRKANDGFFDYKNFFKSEGLTEKMVQELKTSFQKQLVHHPEDSFQRILTYEA